MKMWDIATSYQGGQGLTSFVGTMNKQTNVSKPLKYLRSSLHKGIMKPNIHACYLCHGFSVNIK